MKNTVKMLVLTSIGIVTLFTQVFACGHIWYEDEMPESLR
jgi:cyclic lactone autoinducer peptide